MNALLLALQFLTIAPVKCKLDASPRQWGRSLLAYPLIGLLIGLLVLAISVLLANLLPDLPLVLSAAILLVLWVVITGGLHLDGLADTVDAFGGELVDKGRTLEIMKDPRSGPMAVIALVLLLLLKFAAVLVLLEKDSIAAFIWIPAFARTGILVAFATSTYVRSQGLGSGIAHHFQQKQAYWIIALSLLAPLAFLPGHLWCLLVAVFVFVCWRWRKLMDKRLGGFTGDTLGALVEILELALILSLVLAVSL